MCDPATIGVLIGGAASLGASFLAPKPAKPPPLPGTTPDPVKASGATVHTGDGQTDDTTISDPTSLVATGETRVFGKPVGGLGKSGLSL